MPRGKASVIGATNVSANGYHYTRTAAGWVLTHHLIAQANLGRDISPDEMVRFKDGNKANLNPDNIIVVTRRTSLRGRIARIEAQIVDLQVELDRLRAKLERQEGMRT